MPRYVIFNATSGYIDRFIEVEETDLSLNVEAGEASLITYELVDGDIEGYYVDIIGSPPVYEIKKRPALVPTWDKLYIVANGTDKATITGLPNPSYITIFDKDYDQGIQAATATVTDGSAEITLDTEGRVQMTVETETYQPYEEYITTTTGDYANVITMATRWIDVRALPCNVPETISVDVASIALTAMDVEVRSGEVVSIDTASITLATNDATININQIISIDRKRVYVNTYKVGVFESEIVEVSATADITLTAYDVEIKENETIEVDTTSINITAHDIDYYDNGTMVFMDAANVSITGLDVTIIEA